MTSDLQSHEVRPSLLTDLTDGGHLRLYTSDYITPAAGVDLQPGRRLPRFSHQSSGTLQTQRLCAARSAEHHRAAVEPPTSRLCLLGSHPL